MTRFPTAALRITGAAALLLLGACEREVRRVREIPPSGTPAGITMSDLQAGAAVVMPAARTPYEYNAYAIAQGKTLFSTMNCVGCHAHGGGGMGPPLIDDEWIYGVDPADIFETIVEGRPNGMPSFRGKLSTQQVWQLVAYVRAMSGLPSKDARPARDDHMMYGPSEQRRPRQVPKASFTPPQAEFP